MRRSSADGVSEILSLLEAQVLTMSPNVATATVSFVVGTSGNPRTLMNCLQSIVDFSGALAPLDIVVLDNGSTDETRYVLEEISDTVRSVRCDDLEPWDVALIKGLELATGQYVMLLTSDVALKEGWAEPLLAAMQADPTCGVVSPTIESKTGIFASYAPAAGNGVALLMRMDALVSGNLGDARQVQSSRVILQEDAGTTTTNTAVANSAPAPAPAPAVTAFSTTSAPAPGGGAPEGPVRFIEPTNGVTAGTRLHLGSGTNQIVGWVNIDGDGACSPDLVADLRQPLPYATGSVDAIYSEHLLEHFTLEQGIFVISEFHRVLKPGGVVRIAMPDLFATVIAYLKGWQTEEWVSMYPELDSGARMVNMCFNAWGHEYLYDEADLGLRLTQAGFSQFYSAPWGTSRFPELCGLETRKESRLIMEAIR